MDTTPKAEKNEVSENKPKATSAPTPTVTPPAPHEPRNFLAAFLLASSFGTLGLRHFYLGDKKLGWLRLGLFVGGYLWAFVMFAISQPILAMLGWLAVSVASVWAVVDFFYIYLVVKNDAEGKPLAASQRDKKWAKGIFIVTISLFVLSFLAMVTLMSIVGNEFMKRTNSSSDSSLFEESSQQEYNDFLREIENQQQSPSY